MHRRNIKGIKQVEILNWQEERHIKNIRLERGLHALKDAFILLSEKGINGISLARWDIPLLLWPTPLKVELLTSVESPSARAAFFASLVVRCSWEVLARATAVAIWLLETCSKLGTPMQKVEIYLLVLGVVGTKNLLISKQCPFSSKEWEWQ